MSLQRSGFEEASTRGLLIGAIVLWVGIGVSCAQQGKVVDLKAAPAAAYNLCGENFGGSLSENPKTGEVLFFGSGVNSTPVYRITGWDQFHRQHGEITLP